MGLNWGHILPTLLLLSGCQREQWDDCITSTGPVRMEVRHVAAFDRVELQDRVDLVLEERSDGIVVEAGRNLLGQVVTEVRQGVLHVRDDNRCNWVRSFKPRITVRVPAHAVFEVTLRGSGNVCATTRLHGPLFSVQQHGASGRVDLDMDVDTCRVGLHSGSGEVHGTGTAHYADLYQASMGSMHLQDLATDRVWAFSNGSGDIRCRPVQRLEAMVRFAGDILYAGTPAELLTDITGSGTVRPLP